MSALDPVEAARLARFIDKLLAPAPSGGNALTGMARALLASKHKWPPLDLAFLRLMACSRSDVMADLERLRLLVERAKESTR